MVGSSAKELLASGVEVVIAVPSVSRLFDVPRCI
jgi:hypothetical protein